MVTFICQYCDQTLKKKQVEGHIRGRCSPGAIICIDCSKVFDRGDYKGHISCISEQEKHWGEFAKPKKNKKIAKLPKV
jgi:cell growth-regulating nucleolar protein